ncbi:ABC transporter permease [Limibacillus sp. MBR-115]|jgi:putative spermidine/putrescine transport system permease protein|uniref:ABC transporter permease n=1 Tax=Limibacillus sp. MBR-115 TaxID=3156465 RepID=UPI00339ACA52
MRNKFLNPTWIALYGFAIAVLTFTLLPIFMIFPFAFNSATFLSFPPQGFSLRWFTAFFSEPSWVNATIKSLQIAVFTTIISVTCGTLAAFAIVRKKMRYGHAISIFLLFPMIGPHITFAIGVFGIFSRLNLAGTTVGLILAHSAVAVPFVYINVASRLSTFDASLERAAQSLGASQIECFLRITAPIIAPAIIAGGVFAFIISWDEFIVTYFVADTNTQTLPLRFFSGIQYGVDVTAAAAAALILVALILGIALYRLTSMWINRMKWR